MELPVLYEEKMKALLGPEEFSEYKKSLEAPGFRGLRVNTSKIEAEEFEKISPFPCVKIPWIPNGYYISKDAEASRHPYYAAGLYYLQEPSAMTPARALPVDPGEKVLDLCAAPGGKATELAARVGKEGLLVANDISNSRAKGLLKNLELFGMPQILVTSESPERLADYFPSYFDKILVDAPCSGEGMFRKDPSMIKSWTEHGPEYYAPLQRDILSAAARMLRPGGMLLYSTCTFDPMENEGTVQNLLETDPAFSVVSLKELDVDLYDCFLENGFCPGRADLVPDGRKELRHCVRLYPHRVRGEGHFLALLQKKAQDTPAEMPAKKTSRDRKAIPDALQSFLTVFPSGIASDGAEKEYELRVQQSGVYALPKSLPGIRGLRFLRTGCYLGELEKNRFTPSQALAMALKKEDWPFVMDLTLADERVLRYLKGETLELTEQEAERGSGWYLVCVDGFPLGWGKVINGSLRNKYYPGWRW